MIRSALVPLEGSPATDVAVEHAVNIAKLANCQLIGLGVVDRPGICAPQAEGLGVGGAKEHRDSALLADAQKQVAGFREKFAERCREAGVAFESKVFEDDPYHAMVKESELHDLIITSRHTNFHFETSNRTGETFMHLVKKSPRPVLAVPEEQLVRRPRRMMIGYDGSVAASRALQLFAMLLLKHFPDVIVVTAADPIEHAEEINARACAYLEERGGIVTPMPTLPEKGVFETIRSQVEEYLPWGLTIGAYGETGLKSMFFGSSTKRFIDELKLPLFIYH